MAAPDVEAAADIICSLRDADLAGWTPPWRKQAPKQGELIWPAVARGKRSRRRSPSAGSAGTASAGKGRWGRGSPASPLDYSGGSGSGASTSASGGEDATFCSPATNKVGSIGEPQLTFAATPLPRPNGQRPRKKLKLPEVQQLVRSLEVENESLREEMRALQRACTALSNENDQLEIKLERPNLGNETKDLRGNQQIDLQSFVQSPRDSFVLPDLNLAPEDSADVSPIHSLIAPDHCNFVN